MSFGMFEIAVDNIESWPPRLIALFDENMELLRSYALCRYELDNDDNWKPPRSTTLFRVRFGLKFDFMSKSKSF
jgi:hypothetical protein